jgi:ectoine hydroxylase-related dioxygenase (phytanoyl-CoA dioxygenase family)
MMDRAVLSEAQVEQFQREGYVIIPDFFDEREVAAMRAELERFKREGLGRNVATEGDGQTHSRTKINYQIIPLNTKSTLFRALPFNERVIDAVTQLLGAPVSRILEQIFLKPGRHGAGTKWHTDNAYFKVDDPTKGTGMWIALHDANVANGTLHIIPGSHAEQFEHERDPDSDHHIMMRADESRALPVVIPAGGLIFFNYGIAHCTKANTTDHERAGLAYHFLRTDHIPEQGLRRSDAVELTGPDASGGEREYGQRIAGTWNDEVTRLVPDV